ncbi:MAG TPA: immunoglobulin domain-containing protein [Verrucomicrobiae bacterium]|jgi:hypothetical protein|nr:immunoglobulin domain-containing protein [Verrucomicrobiae bacterium]
MKFPLNTPLKVVFACSLVFAIITARAGSLLLDFGATTVAPADATLDMGHFSGAVPSTEISWNKIVNADNSSLVYSDGSAATGVSIVVGRCPAATTNVVDYTKKNISSSALGTAETQGIYTNTSPTKDGIFATGTATVNTNAMGIRVDGLPAGTYTLYLSGRNSNTGFSTPEQFFATNGASAGTFTFVSNTTASAVEANSGTRVGSGNPTQADAITSTFAYGDNCVHLVVTLNSGDSLFLSVVGVASNEFRGFMNAVEIVPGSPVLTNFPATIGVQPANVSAYEGATISISNVKYGGVPPLTYQWYHDTNPIPDATNAALTLANVTTNDAGNYTVSVSNVVATSTSSNAVVTIVPFFNTAQMTNVWSLLPGDRFYVTATNANNQERGLAYDPATGDLLLVAQSPSNNVVVLNSTNGEEKYFMNLSGIPSGAAGANTVGVGDDGAVYVANVTANAAGTFYTINRWDNDSADATATLLFSGDPGAAGPAGLRWGDNIAVRGAGLNTQILTAPGANTNVVCLFTMDASGAFVLPNLITITNVPTTSAFAQFGIAFGPGDNTFWAKTLNQPLMLVQYDLASGTGGVIYTAPTSVVPGGFRFISTDSTQKWMAGVMSVASGLPDNVRLYDISNFTNNPVLADQEINTTTNQSTFLNGAGTGATAFGGGYVFALDSNNGIRAFLINTNTASLPFSITGIIRQPDSTVILTWESISGHTYQVQSTADLTSGSWAPLGSSILATGSETSTTNTVSDPVQFFRVQAQ